MFLIVVCNLRDCALIFCTKEEKEVVNKVFDMVICSISLYQLLPYNILGVYAYFLIDV